MTSSRRLKCIVILSSSMFMLPQSQASLAGETLRLQCQWSARFDVNANRTSAASGSVSYMIEVRGYDIKIRAEDRDAPMRGRANAAQFSASREYEINGAFIQEFVAIDIRTGAIEAWTMNGQTGWALIGRCNPPIQSPDAPRDRAEPFGRPLTPNTPAPASETLLPGVTAPAIRRPASRAFLPNSSRRMSAHGRRAGRTDRSRSLSRREVGR